MDFTFTPEQEALSEQAREFLAATPEPTGAQLAELGWTGVSIAEEDGGAGLTFIDGGRMLVVVAKAPTADAVKAAAKGGSTLSTSP